jgi:hypothetical protein
MWLTFAAICAFVAAVGPAVALHVYEVRRWRRETGRRGGWLAMRYDTDYQREARRTGRAYLGLLMIPWFLFGMVIFGNLLDAL